MARVGGRQMITTSYDWNVILLWKAETVPDAITEDGVAQPVQECSFRHVHLISQS
jgi:hypothetical protein